MAVRALLNLPRTARRGEVIEVRATIAHAMETGYRADSEGRIQPRDIVRRVECRYDGETVFVAELHPAIAANPYVAFPLLATRSGAVSVSWSGDNGLQHTETANLDVTA